MEHSTSLEGDLLAGDALQVREMIAWGRAAGVPMSRVTVGGCTVELVIAAPVAATDDQRPPQRHRESIYGQFGGDLIPAMLGVAGTRGTGGGMVADPPGDLHPALGEED